MATLYFSCLTFLLSDQHDYIFVSDVIVDIEIQTLESAYKNFFLKIYLYLLRKLIVNI